jgi:hypothetical protein
MSVNLKEIKIYIDNKDYSKVELFFNENKYENINKKIKNGFISLQIRYFICINKNEELIKILNNFNLMKRDYILLIIHFYNIDKKFSIDTFNKYIINKKKLENTDIDKLINNKCYDILKLLNNYFVSCSMIENVNNYSIFYKYIISIEMKNKILEFYKSKLKEKYLLSLISKIHNIDCIVDGGNISHLNGGNCDYKFINKISQNIMKKYKNPLYIFHNRHKNKIKTFLNSVNHFITPVNQYDDYYIIVAMILSNKPIITNDNFKDHIFDLFKHLDTVDFKIKNYINENILNYTKSNLNQQIKYSKCIQIIDNNIYIPSKNGMYKVLI